MHGIEPTYYSQGDLSFYVSNWGDVMDAIARFDLDQDWSKRRLAGVMKDPWNGVNAVAQIGEHIARQLRATRRAIKVRRLMLEYLAAQGLEGEPMERAREKARERMKADHRRKEREKNFLEEAFLRGPAHYAEAVKEVEREARREALHPRR